jgi:hypothetical protein
MTVEQRKLNLINLITSIDNESLLIEMETLIETNHSKTPESIMKLLELSDKSIDFTEHKSIREFLK